VLAEIVGDGSSVISLLGGCATGGFASALVWSAEAGRRLDGLVEWCRARAGVLGGWPRCLAGLCLFGPKCFGSKRKCQRFGRLEWVFLVRSVQFFCLSGVCWLVFCSGSTRGAVLGWTICLFFLGRKNNVL